jgi:hypothetical protein
MRLAEELMQHGRITQSQRQTVGMRQLSSQGECFADPRARLIGIAQMTQSMCGKAAAEDSEVAWKTGEAQQGVVLCWGVEGNCLFQVRSRRAQVPHEERGMTERPVGHQEERRVGLALSEVEELRSHLSRRQEFGPHDMERDKARECQEELRSFAHLLSDLTRAGVRAPDFLACLPLGRYQGEAKCGQ